MVLCLADGDFGDSFQGTGRRGTEPAALKTPVHASKPRVEP